MLIASLQELRTKVIPFLRSLLLKPEPWQRAFSADTETFAPESTSRNLKTDGLILDRARIMLLSLCHGRTSFSIPSSNFDIRFPAMGAILKELAPFFLDPRLRKVFHHANYDLNMLLNHGIECKNIYCTMIAGAYHDENQPRALAEQCILIGMLLKKAHNKKEREELFTNLAKLAPYAEDDVIGTWELYQARETGTISVYRNRTKEDIAKLKLTGVRRYHFIQEMKFLRVALRMERKGMLIDAKKLQAVDNVLARKQREYLTKIYLANGRPFNVNSPKQKAEFLYGKLKMPVLFKSKKTEAPSTNSEALFYMKGKHAIIDILLDYSKITKLRDTTNQLSGLASFADFSGRIHASLNTVGAVTYRCSCSNPNLQNVPHKMDKYGIRKCFVARKGYSLVVADYSQLELRLMGIMSEDPALVEAYRKNQDIHDKTMKGLGISIRTIAKNCNFGLMYEGSAWTLARQLTLDGVPTSPEQAQVYVDKFFELYCKVPTYRNRLYAMAREQGFVVNLLGMPRSVPDIDSGSKKVRRAAERMLINNIIQGSGALWIKRAMIAIDEDPELQALGYYMTMQIHDELVGECPTENVAAVEARLAVLMGQEPKGLIKKLPFPITTSIGSGPSWAEAKH